MFNQILVVCVGNICRSPMAEALLKQAAPHCQISSAGVGALVGSPADPIALQLMQARGFDIKAHRARQLTSDMACQADLILVMEKGHERAVHRIAPESRGRVHTLGKWTGVEIADPYKKSTAYFEKILRLIDAGIESWVEKL